MKDNISAAGEWWRRQQRLYSLPKPIADIVQGICADYERRKKAIYSGAVTGKVLERYIELNNAIELSLSNIEIGIRKCILENIQFRQGYEHSYIALTSISKNSYYVRRKKVMYDIAKYLNLV